MARLAGALSAALLVLFAGSPLAAAVWNCQAALICNDAFPCAPEDAAQPIPVRITDDDDTGATVMFGLDGGAESSTFQRLAPTGADVAHYARLEDDGSAMLLSVFQDGSLFITTHALVLGAAYLGQAAGTCEAVQ